MRLPGQKSERIFFRKLQPEDITVLIEFFENPGNAKYLIPVSKDVTTFVHNWYKKQAKRFAETGFGFCALIHRESGKYLGQGGLIYQDVEGQRDLEIGYHLLPDARGKGYATEMAQFCKNFAFETNLADSLISLIHPGNVKSRKVAQRNGMSFDRKAQFHNIPVDVFRIYKKDWKINT